MRPMNFCVSSPINNILQINKIHGQIFVFDMSIQNQTIMHLNPPIHYQKLCPNPLCIPPISKWKATKPL